MSSPPTFTLCDSPTNKNSLRLQTLCRVPGTVRGHFTGTSLSDPCDNRLRRMCHFALSSEEELED